MRSQQEFLTMTPKKAITNLEKFLQIANMVKLLGQSVLSKILKLSKDP